MQIQEHLESIQKIQDLTIGSEELLAIVRDWPEYDELNDKIVDLMRPFASYLNGKSVLEISAGYGTMTRFFGENGISVLALEGHPEKAEFAAARCRDLATVTITCTSFENYGPETRFDIITFTGGPGHVNPFEDSGRINFPLLKKAADLLNDNGILILPVPNIFANNVPGQATDPAIDKQSIADIFKKVGLGHTEFLYPFPGCQLPQIILKESALTIKEFNTSNLLLPIASSSDSSGMSVYQLMQEPITPSVIGSLSSSFLLIAGKDAFSITASNILGFSYSSKRRKRFCKANYFIQGFDDRLLVRREKLYPQSWCSTDGEITQVVQDEAHQEGTLYFIRLLEIVGNQGWSIDDVVKWASFYYQLLKRLSFERDGQSLLQGKYADAVPFNMIENKDGISLFDLEWKINTLLPLHYVFFRGLFHSFGRIATFCRPAPGTPDRILTLITEIAGHFFDQSRNMIPDFLEREKRYFGSILPGGNYSLHDFPLNYL
ncbi:MAG: methyltransferase domain-containing protein [Bacteroidetes bacterium]|nr:methyltransferase domain-containing protein [Bacteroidota bacterium]